MDKDLINLMYQKLDNDIYESLVFFKNTSHLVPKEKNILHLSKYENLILETEEKIGKGTLPKSKKELEYLKNKINNEK